MCELEVIVEKEVVFKNVIYAKSIEDNVFVKDVLGKSMEFKNHKISEINISQEQLVLSPIKPQK